MMPWRVANSVCTLSQKVTAPGSAMRWSWRAGIQHDSDTHLGGGDRRVFIPLLAGERGLLELHGG